MDLEVTGKRGKEGKAIKIKLDLQHCCNNLSNAVSDCFIKVVTALLKYFDLDTKIIW